MQGGDLNNLIGGSFCTTVPFLIADWMARRSASRIDAASLASARGKPLRPRRRPVHCADFLI
jgi:hypothetical protein